MTTPATARAVNEQTERPHDDASLAHPAARSASESATAVCFDAEADPGTVAAIIARAMSERELLANITDMARRLGWLSAENGVRTRKMVQCSPTIERRSDAANIPRHGNEGLTSMRPQSTSPRVCSIPDCDGKVYGHGWCNKHWARWRRHGDPLAMTMAYPSLRNRTVAERFWEKVNKESNCWEWQAAKDGHGYGQLRVDGRGVLAHRLSYELVIGPIPDGMIVLHRCDNPLCVNPEHLLLGTHKDNSVDMSRKGRARNGYGDCPPRQE